MIANERQYSISKAELARFEKSQAAYDEREPSSNVDPRMPEFMHDAIASELEVLRRQIDRYEQLRDG